MAENTSGRHRSPGRYNPLSELSVAVTRSTEPAIKTSAVLAASGGLVAAFALPAQAGNTAVDDAPKADPATTTSMPAATGTLVLTTHTTDDAAPAVDAPSVTAPDAAAPAASSFGELDVKAEAKPEPEPQVQQAAADAASGARDDSTASRSADPEPTTTPAPATGGVLDVAASLVGIPYVYGGTTPSGFDCSGFTQYVFAQVGLSLPRTAEEQRLAVTPVSDPQPGDLVFYGVPAYHVGIYAGNGMMYDSPRTGSSVSLRAVFSGVSMYGRVG